MIFLSQLHNLEAFCNKSTYVVLPLSRWNNISRYTHEYLNDKNYHQNQTKKLTWILRYYTFQNPIDFVKKKNRDQMINLSHHKLPYLLFLVSLTYDRINVTNVWMLLINRARPIRAKITKYLPIYMLVVRKVSIYCTFKTIRSLN